MRLIIDSLIALMLVAILGGMALHHRREQQRLDDFQFVHESLARLHEQAVYHGALKDVELSDAGFPLVIRPEWFGERLPLNVMVSTRQPWIDVAPPGDTHDHPPDPVIDRADQAGFWYNPARGVFRARVPRQMSEQETLRLYNQLNGTALMSLPSGDALEDRRPQPMQLAEGEDDPAADRFAAENDAGRTLSTVTEGAESATRTTLMALPPKSR